MVNGGTGTMSTWPTGTSRIPTPIRREFTVRPRTSGLISTPVWAPTAPAASQSSGSTWLGYNRQVASVVTGTTDITFLLPSDKKWRAFFVHITF